MPDQQNQGADKEAQRRYETSIKWIYEADAELHRFMADYGRNDSMSAKGFDEYRRRAWEMLDRFKNEIPLMYQEGASLRKGPLQ